jgi:ferritin-like metal-binding protein YciE
MLPNAKPVHFHSLSLSAALAGTSVAKNRSLKRRKFMNKNITQETNRARNRERASKSTTSRHRAAADGADSEDNGLHDLLIDEIADVYNAEKQLLKALPKMVKAAQSTALREAFDNHLSETERHVTRLEEAAAQLNEKIQNKKCQAMEGLLEEGSEMMEEHEGKPTIDAVLIAAAQKVEHYEIASYGTLCAWAKELGEGEVVQLLVETLGEEKAADEILTELAEETANIRAEEAE